MKRLILTVVLLAIALLSLIVAKAHNIVPVAYCSTTKKVTFVLSGWTVGEGKYAFLYATHTNTMGITSSNYQTWGIKIDLSKYTTSKLNDSIGAITPNGIVITVPSWVKVVWGIENDEYGLNWIWGSEEFDYHHLVDKCITVPIFLETWDDKIINHETV
jgi:hypothetical protein